MDALAVSRKDETQHSDKLSLASIIEPCITTSPGTPAVEVLDLFLSDPDLRVVPVVDALAPVGMVNRHFMVEMFSRPFRRDLFGKRPIRNFMDTTPIIVDIETDIDDLAQTLVSAGLQQMLDGFLVIGPNGAYIGIGNAQDLLSEVTKRKQAHLYQLAHYDALTGLPNRILFRDRLNMAIEQAARNGRHVAVVFIDIDHFKRINDTLGHPVGDELLQVVSRRFDAAIRGCDTLARMGGDEFTLVLTELVNPGDAAQVIRKLRTRLREPIMLSGQETVVSASIGIAVYPDDGDDMNELVRRADISLYAAKRAGRDTYRFFDKSHDVIDDSRLFLEHELRTALAQGAVKPFFQAIVDARSGATVGAEALARWRHPDKGMIAPSTFVPVAEDTGLIKQLGQSVTRAAALAARRIIDEAPLRLSLNVSAREMRSGAFVDSLIKQLEAADYPADRVQLEITERLFLEPSEALLSKLDRLRKLGIKIAIDDFGVGSTSLSLLHILPIDVLKIDRSFIAGSDSDMRVDALVRAIIDMGHALGLEIVAEGVETPEQARRLTGYGCDYLQGFLFCQPMPSADFAAWLALPPESRSAQCS